MLLIKVKIEIIFQVVIFKSFRYVFLCFPWCYFRCTVGVRHKLLPNFPSPGIQMICFWSSSVATGMAWKVKYPNLDQSFLLQGSKLGTSNLLNLWRLGLSRFTAFACKINPYCGHWNLGYCGHWNLGYCGHWNLGST